MAFYSIQRNSVSPVPPLTTQNEKPEEAFQLLQKWLPQLLYNGYPSRMDTYTDPAPSGTAVNVMILPKSYGLWICHTSIGVVGDAVNYQAVGLVTVDGTSARMLLNWNAPNQTMSLSGNTLISTQFSGGPQVITGTSVQITHYSR